jgi:hypothetical protein
VVFTDRVNKIIHKFTPGEYSADISSDHFTPSGHKRRGGNRTRAFCSCVDTKKSSATQ